MKNLTSPLSLLVAAMLITAAACNKFNEPAQLSPTIVYSDDQVQVAAEMDAVLDEANHLLLENDTLNFGGVKEQLCDADFTVDSTADIKRITITYNGNNCGPKNRTRKGSVVLSLPKGSRWNDVGAVLTIQYQNLSVRRVADQQTIIFNGNATVRNITGGSTQYLDSIGSMAHDVASNAFSIKFSNDTTCTWMIAKQRDYSYDEGVVISTTGKHADGNILNISEWGLNRAGQHFKTVIDQPLITKQACLYRVTNGKMVYVTDRHLVITYGLSLNGLPMTCPGYKPYYFSVVHSTNEDNETPLIWAY
jgi:hypothetical protein